MFQCVFEIFIAFEELVLRSLRTSPLMAPFLVPGGWQELKCVCWKVCAHIKNRVLFESLALIYIYVSKNVISVSKISAVNFIVG